MFVVFIGICVFFNMLVLWYIGIFYFLEVKVEEIGNINFLSE